MKRIGMMNVREILCLRHDADLTRAEVSAAAGVSEWTVTNVVKRARAAGLSWPLPDGLDDVALQARLYPAPDVQDGRTPAPDLDAAVPALFVRSHALIPARVT